MFRCVSLIALSAFAISFASAQTSTKFETQISFEPNQGQAGPNAAYLYHGSRSAILLEPGSVTLTYRANASDQKRFHDLRMTFANSDPNARITAEASLPGKVNYLLGRDPSKWKTNLPTFARVRYHNLYPGVDAVFYGDEGNLEYDLVLAPGATLDRVKLAFDRDHPAHVDSNGDLVIHTASGDLREHAPTVYQLTGSERRPIKARFALRADNTVAFEVAAYDHSRELVVDPTLAYSTLIGTAYLNNIAAVAVDGSGNSYVTGTTYYNFPTKNPAEGNQPSEDAFVTKFSSTGGSLIYSTYLGGNGVIDQGTAIGVDRFGSAYVTGLTDSTDFPVTPGAPQPAFAGGRADVFATKLSPSGSSFVYSTYLGGNADDQAAALAIDSQQRLYLTGFTCSSNFPVVNAYQPTSGTGVCSKPSPGSNAFVARINAAGTALDYSTYLGGTTGDSGTGIAVDSTFNAYVTGSAGSPDFPTTPGAYQPTLRGSSAAFVTKFSADGRSLVFSTFLGGTGSDFGYGIAVDSSDRPYVTGVSDSADFPVTAGAFQTTNHGNPDGFVTKLWKTGGGLIYSTYLGGSSTDIPYSIAVDSAGEAYVAGVTSSTNFPVKNAIQATYGGGNGDGFVTKLSSTGGSLVYSTFFGGSGNDSAACIRLDAAGAAYVGGFTNSTNFPTTAGAYQRTLKGSSDGWLIKINP